jgi:hypothetical protein
MTATEAATLMRALDEMAMALVDHEHVWAIELRRLYERARRIAECYSPPPEASGARRIIRAG